ncbi:MAG: inorganic phosphate transporter [Deltaproteobacteria bacterium]|nr:inorganic phosphate transporter [Deltaproteobacteria bacterium]
MAVSTKLERRPGTAGTVIFSLLLGAGVIYAVSHLIKDLQVVKTHSILPFMFLIGALLIALGFEFVNGFHDTANAVATVIYTHSLEPHTAVAWSGLWNFTGVLVSSGAVAFAIVSLLPVELILKVGSAAGFAMVFSLLIAAMIWNLGTWYLGLPASSSHTLIGSVIGVGIANELMSSKSGTSGVDWSQAASIGKTLLVSPLFGFVLAAVLLLIAKVLITDKRLYAAPEGTEPPPFWIRVLLILTCTAVSFAHGSNDGQKGMGLIMLILIGIVPTAYALNRAIPPSATQDFVAVSKQTVNTLDKYVPPETLTGDPHDEVADYIEHRKFSPSTMLALRQIVNDVGNEMADYGEMSKVPDRMVSNFRNDMYLVSEALRLMKKSGQGAISANDWKELDNYRAHIDLATKFIPPWVKVAVALALGLGTMVGWKRIVVTVGEKIGKQHLAYSQGAAAEITAAATIGAADYMGLPVSTTHVLSSGIAGTMTANGSGLQLETVRNIALAWVLTLPAAIMLAAFLFYVFRSTF